MGGTAPPEALIRALDRHGIHIVHLWGMTETTPLATTGQFERTCAIGATKKNIQARAKQGCPAPFVELELAAVGLRRDDEVPCDGETAGELEVRGPWVASALLQSPEQTNRWTADGWFAPATWRTVDENGVIKIVDRSKDLMKSGGEWISSVDLENALMGHPAVKEACGDRRVTSEVAGASAGGGGAERWKERDMRKS